MQQSSSAASMSIEEFRALRQRVNAVRRTTVLEAVSPRLSRETPPLSFAQERLWFLDRLGLVGSAYNIPTTFHLRGAVDIEALERAFAELLRRHDSLRTRFDANEGKPVQIIAPPSAVFILEVAEHPFAASEERTHQLLVQLTERPFDLAAGPLIRVSLLRLGSNEHLLHLVLHHIISDGWSRGVLFQELAALYAAYRAGQPSPLEEPRLQFADYVLWQRDWLQGPALREQLDFWKDHLKGAPAKLNLPTDRPRPPVGSFKGGMVHFDVPDDLCAAIHETCRREGVTSFMLMLAVFQVLLARLSGQTDIVVGSPIANRRSRDLENLVGYFVNMIVLRTDIGGNPSFRELLGKVKERTLGAFANQDTPLEKLVEEFLPLRDFSHQPLFQVSLTMQNIPEEPVEFAGMEVSEVRTSLATARFDIELFVYHTKQGISGTIEYASDLFDRSRIERMARQLLDLLASAVADPTIAVSRLPLLPAQERRQLLEEWNATAAPYPQERCLHEWISEQAARTPHAVALVCESQQLRYAQLEERSNQLGHYLRGLGVGPEVIVGLCVERSVEMVVGLLGILKAGGAYLPLDPGYPAERLVYMLSDAQAPLLLTQEKQQGVFGDYAGRIVRIDTDWSQIAAEPATAVGSTSTADNLAYVIYTSGSTGKPKGVMVEHRSVVNLLTAMSATIAMGPGQVLVSVAPVSFDMSVPDLYWPLVSGAQLVICPRAVSQDGQRLRDLLTANRATVMQATPTTWRMLLEAGWQAQGFEVICGGEALPVDLARALIAGSAVVWNLYGPTEATVWSTLHAVQSAQAISIGRPLGNVQVYVLDAQLQPVPIGVTGELYIGGAGVARGYCGQAALTAERFVAHPWGSGERLYRTGDLVRYLPEGTLQFQGRADQQVKLRGYRIELTEIEAALLEHPGVAHAAVALREPQPDHQSLIAYVVPTRAGVDASALLAYMKKKVPGYLLPDDYVLVPVLPRHEDGSIDYAGLPAPRVATAPSFAAAATPTEHALSELWCETLGIQAVSVTASFFALGGSSLQALLMVARVQDSFGVEIAVATLFEGPTIRELAMHVDVVRQVQQDATATSSDMLAEGEEHGLI